VYFKPNLLFNFFASVNAKILKLGGREHKQTESDELRNTVFEPLITSPPLPVTGSSTMKVAPTPVTGEFSTASVPLIVSN
jgi:hypothetical protein